MLGYKSLLVQAVPYPAFVSLPHLGWRLPMFPYSAD